MKIKVAKQDLEAGFQVVNPSLAGTGSDLSSHYVFRVRDEGDGNNQFVEVLTYNQWAYASCPLRGASIEDAKDGDAFTVEGWRLKQWLPAAGEGVVVEIDVDGSDVTMTVPKGAQKFQSLDPSNFPWWDKTLEESEEVAVIDAGRMGAALDFAKRFASDQDTKTKKTCVCEMQGGVFYATNRIVAAAVEIRGMEKSNMRIHVKNAPQVLSFLKTIQGDVGVLEHDRGVIFKRGDGAMFGAQRFVEAFQTFGRPGADQRVWILPVTDLKDAIPFLTAGAAKEDSKIRLKRATEDGPITLTMATVGGDFVSVDVPVVESETVGDKLPTIPDNGFPVSHLFLQKIVELFAKDGDNIRVGVNIRERQGEKTGYLRFADSRFAVEDEEGAPMADTEDGYLAVLAWTRELGT